MAFVKNGGTTNQSRLVKAMKDFSSDLQAYEIPVSGVFGCKAKITCRNVSISSEDLDVEFNVKFDDDLEPNECEITIYNLTNATIKNFETNAQVTIEAGYGNDTGVVFVGFVSKCTTKREGADKVTKIKCFDDVSTNTVKNKTYSAGTKASTILKDLLSETDTPIAVFDIRRDWTYKDEQKVDGDLFELIRKYSDVCGVSTYINKGKIYVRYIKDGDHNYFTVCEDTGLIGSPEHFTEEQTAEDYKDTVEGYKIEMLFQHRMTTGSICELSAEGIKGVFRVRKGEHIFNSDEAKTKVEVI